MSRFRLISILFGASFLFSVCLHHNLLGQYQTGRFELPTRWNHGEFLVLPADSNGLVLIQEEKHDRSSNENNVKVVILDRNLIKTAEKKISVPLGFGLRNHADSGSKLYLVFTKEIVQPDISFFIAEIDLRSGNIQLNKVSSEVPFDLLAAEVVNGTLTLTGETNGIPLLLQFNPQHIQFKGIEINRDKGSVISLRSNDDGASFNLITLETRNKKPVLHFRTYYETELVFDKTIEMKADVLEARSVGFIDGNIAVAGTYGSRSNNYIQGLFYILLTPGDAPDVVKYHDFSTFENFFSFEPTGREDKLNSKAQELADAGKDIKLDKFLFIRQLVKIDGKLVLSLDVHRKEFNNLIRNDRNHYELMHDNGSRNLDSYLLYNAHNPELFNYYRNLTRRYDEPIQRDSRNLLLLEHWVVGFEYNGDVSWDNSMSVLEKDRLTSNRIIGSSIGRDQVNFLYYHEDNIVFSTVPYSAERVKEYMVPIGLTDGNDKLREGSGYVGNWYDSVMYVWGYQRVKGSDGKRDVLYINKIEFPGYQHSTSN